VVQLPGVQDTAKAKDILGRTATLELRLVDESAEGLAAERGTGPVPFGAERTWSATAAVIVKREVLLTGENLTDAQAGFDDQQQPAVHLTLDSQGRAHLPRRDARERRASAWPSSCSKRARARS
jgi:preprotein translocase subunit SecD